MEKELTCIVCPNGCRLHVSEENGQFEVTGNKCKRGEAFGISEMTNPMRTISSTAATAFKEHPVVPVRVSKDIPKDKIFDIMKEINGLCITERLKRGDIVIQNVQNTGADVIVTSDILLL